MKKKTIIIAIITVVIIGSVAAILLINDHQRRSRIIRAFDAIETNLVQSGIEPSYVERTGGCGRMDLKYGQGARLCSLGIDIKPMSVESSEEANILAKIVYDSIVTSGVTLNQAYPDFTEISKSLQDSIGGSYEQTSSYCGSAYSYTRTYAKDDILPWRREDSSGTVWFKFGCDDNSWWLDNIANKFFNWL